MSLEIRALRAHEIEAAKEVIYQVAHEFFVSGDFEPWREKMEADGLLRDVDEVQTHYFQNGGIFLALVDDETIVGTGAIRRLDSQIGELKRMWFLPAYRRRGLGFQMAQQLLDWARKAGYEKILLDTTTSQLAAQKLYRRLGFQEIGRTNDGPGNLFFELDLRSSP